MFRAKEQKKDFGEIFLGAGAMKASTTWLYSLLQLHPEMHVTPEKELHYFHHSYVDNQMLSDSLRMEYGKTKYLVRYDPRTADINKVRDAVAWTVKFLDNPVNDAWFLNLFPPADVPGYRCDLSNLHTHLPVKAWRDIAKRCERLRVLYILRDPVDRLWSHVKFHLKYTNQTSVLDDWGPKEFTKFIRQPFIRENNEYGRALRGMKKGLSDEMLKVMFFEDIHADPRAAMADLERFLGIEPFDYPDHLLHRKVNISPDLPMPPFFPELIARDSARIAKELRREGLDIPQSWSV